MASGSRSESVRGLYTPPAEEWVFLPPTVSPPSPSPSAPAHLPTPFSPSDDPDVPSMGMYGPLQLFTAEFFSTAIGMPFEVGKTLLQIEYRPRKRFSTADPASSLVATEKVPGEEYELEEEDQADQYFSDRLSDPTYIPPPATAVELPPVDGSGYLPDLHPSWLLKDDPDVSRGNGVLGMIRRIRYTPSEGLPGLWKGQLITTIHSLLSNILQPQIHSGVLLLAPAPIPDVPLPALPAPAIPLGLSIASHLLTHLLLSPMEVIRTRIIASPTHPSTPSSVGMFNRMVQNEGGIGGVYLSSSLLIPAILEHTLRPLLTLSIPLLLERQFQISPELAPITYSLCDLSLNLASLLILLPIETVRKRLQVQSRSQDGKRIKTVVQVRQQPYFGVVHALWSIVTEETGKRRRTNMSEKDEGGLFAGIRQLYRGVSPERKPSFSPT